MDARALPPRPSLGQYRTQAKELLAAARAGDAEAAARLAAARRRPDPAAHVLADAQLALAREHGFDGWPHFARHVEAVVAAGPVGRFERAADAVADGDLATLDALLAESPGLARERSTRSHAATLLHYTAANGVEDFRQRTPANAPDVARRLLAAGAEVDARCRGYGESWTAALELVVSSVHPARAGVQVALVDVLADGGAALHGVDGDGAPLHTALVFHYPAAAAALVRRGAPVETLVAAAGLGRAPLVRELLADRLRTARRDLPRWMRVPRTHAAHLAAALRIAAEHGHADVVTLLLDAGADPSAADGRRYTALHWAAHYGHLPVVDRLLAAGAPLDTPNVYGGAPLGQALWSAANDPQVSDYLPIVERLLAAGASTDGAGPSGIAALDDAVARHRR